MFPSADGGRRPAIVFSAMGIRFVGLDENYRTFLQTNRCGSRWETRSDYIGLYSVLLLLSLALR
jgi:hypothetical protein